MQKIYDRRWINTRTEYQWVDGKGYVKVQNEGYWYEGPMALATNPPTRVGNSWAFYDEGTESGSSIIGSINNNPTKGAIAYDDTFFFRADEEETANNKALNQRAQLEYRIDTTGTGSSYGSWTPVNATSSVIRTTTTASISDGATTSQRLGGGYSFVSPNGGFDDGDGLAGTANSDLQNNGMEWLWSVQMRSADVSEDDLIQLRYTLDEDGTLLDTEPTWPTITAPAGVVTTYTSSGDTQAIKAAGTGVAEVAYEVYTASGNTQAIKAAGTGVAEVAYEVYTASGNTQAIKAAGTGVAKSEEAAYYERILIQEPRLYLPNEKPVGSVVIDWDHPSTYGLKAAYLFDNIVGGDTVKALNGFGPDITLETDTSTLPYIEVRNGIKGLGKENSHQSFGYIAAGEIPTAGDDVSCIMYGVNGNSSSTGLFTMYGPTGGQTDFQHWFGSASFQWKPFDTDGAEGDALNMFSVSDWPSPFNIEINAIAWQNSNTNEMAFFTRRASNTLGPCFKAMGPSSITNGCTTWPTDRIWILGMDADSIGTNNGDGTRAQWWGGRYNYLFFFNREIHEAEAFSLTQDPFQILKPA
jgi:hypothetical protein